MTLPAALAPLASLRQWVTYRLTPIDGKPGKMTKFPCDWRSGEICSAHEPGNWTTYEQALAHKESANRGHGCGVGFVLSAGDPYWFVDIDNCLTVDNEWSPLAKDLIARLGGAAVEVSQSGRGLHIIGSGVVPKHRCKNIPLGLELYTERRFIAITGTHAQGSVAAQLDGPMAALVETHFAPKLNAPGATFDDWTSEPCDDWRGPTDDDELIRRARAFKPKVTTAAALRPGSEPERVTFEALWTADVGALAAAWPDSGPHGKAYDASSADLSLAMRLAYWTGRDCERIERLMRMSGLMRDKYERTDYIEGTIMMAAGSVEKVCQDKQVGAPAPPIEVKTASGELRVLSLSAEAQGDKTSHLAIEYWLAHEGYTIAHDIFADRVLLNGKPSRDETEREAWFRIRETSFLKFPKELFKESFQNIAWANRFDPLVDWLAEAQPTWDGVPRIDNWMTAYLGVEETPYSRAIGALFLTAAVRRARQPGAKFDEIIVLEGPQGIEKSTAIACLSPAADWFCDDFNVSMSSKELLEATQGKWLVEAPELSKLNSSEVEHVKHMLSRRFDRARMAYKHVATEQGRRWVPFASTNGTQYLTDPTGNRRFWPVRVGRIDLAAIMCDRDQLWAEAAQREASGASIRLDPSLWPMAAEEQAKRVVVDAVAETFQGFFAHFASGKIRSDDIWTALNVPIDRRQNMGRKVGDAMKGMGWEKIRVRQGENLPYFYVKGSRSPEIFWDITSRSFVDERPKLTAVT